MLTQLCLAVALLALHMESWLTVVPDLISNLTTPPEQAAVKLPCLLELLTVLPEEVENFKVGIMPRRRQAFREMLKAEPRNPDLSPDPSPNANRNLTVTLTLSLTLTLTLIVIPGPARARGEPRDRPLGAQPPPARLQVALARARARQGRGARGPRRAPQQVARARLREAH